MFSVHISRDGLNLTYQLLSILKQSLGPSNKFPKPLNLTGLEANFLPFYSSERGTIYSKQIPEISVPTNGTNKACAKYFLVPE